MSGRSRRRRLPDPQDLLHDRRPARLEDLFELIHEVNPTGRELSGRKLAEAYALKARLQSLLIERFGDRLRVEEVPEAPEGTIGLVHRTYDKDACHAILRELSPEAQAWVRLQQDLRFAEAHGPSSHPERAGPVPVPVAERAPQTGPAGLLERGEAGLADYDFELARECFQAALSHPDASLDEPMMVRAARALLDLLVDRLADDQGALALREGLPPPAAQDEEVRCLLALAAARRGERAAAEKLVKALEHERVHEVRIELAKGALRAGHLDECERMLALVPAGSPYSSSAQQVADAVRGRRAEAAKPVEKRLRAVLASGDLGLAERLARELLAMHGDSELARRALSEVRRAREAAEAEALAGQIETALAANDTAGARAALERLRATRGRRPELEERLERAERARAKARANAATAELVRQLGGELDERVVEVFWAASETVRDGARRQVPRPEIGWLFELGPVKGHGHGAMNAARAAVALARAERALNAGDPAAAAGAATPHEELARRVPRGRALFKRLSTALAEERRRMAAVRLAEAKRMAGDNVSDALALLESIDDRDLDDCARGRCAALRQRLQTAELVQRERETLESAEARGDLLRARAAAARLAQATREGERAAWTARREGLTQEIRTLWNEDEAAGAVELCDLRPDPVQSVAAVQVTQDGDAFVVARQCGRRIFIRVIHLDASRSRSAVLRSPEPFKLKNAQVEGRTLWLVAEELVLRVDLDSFDVLDLERLDGMDLRGRVVNAILTPGARRLWVGCIGPRGPAVAVLDSRRWTVERHLEGYQGVFPLWGAPSHRVVLSRRRNDVEMADDRGARMSTHQGSYLVHGAVVHPGGRAFVVLMSDIRPAGSGLMLVARVWLPSGRWGKTLELGSMNPNGFRQAVTSLECGTTFVSCATLREGARLIALGADGEGLTELWRTPSAPHVFLGHDCASRHVLAVRNDGETVRLIRLGSEPVELGSAAPLPEDLPLLAPYKTCSWQPERIRQQASAYRAVLPLVDRERVSARIRRQLDLDLESIVALHACSTRRENDEELLERLRAKHGGKPIVRMLLAEPLIQNGEHAKALESLQDIRLGELQAETAQHIAHLKAICHLVLGAEKAARRAVRDASGFAAKSCNLTSLRRLLEALLAPRRKLEADAKGGTLRGLVARLRAADRDLERGDAEAAKTRLEHPVIWVNTELQCMARLAEAYLRLAEGDATWRLRKRRVLAELLEAMAQGARASRLSLGSDSWTGSRLAELAERARSWLHGDGVDGAGRLPSAVATEDLRGFDNPFVFTAFEGDAPASIGTVFSDPDPVFGRYERFLLAEARAVQDRHPRHRLVGLVLDPRLPEAQHHRLAREHLLGEPSPGPEVAVVVTLEGAFQVLKRWRNVFDDFNSYHRTSVLMDSLTLLLVRPAGAGFRRVSLGKP